MFIEKTPNNNSPDLKAAREAKGLSLEDVFSKTRVRVAYLQAIENKEFHLLPVPVYTKNFIKIYVRFLGMDSESIIKDYDDYLSSKKEERTIPPDDEPGEKSLLAGMLSRKTYGLAALVLIIIIASYWLISRQDKTSSNIINSTGVTANAVQETKAQSVQPSLNTVGSAPAQMKANPTPAPNEANKQLPVEAPITPAVNSTNLASVKQRVSLPVDDTPTATGNEAAGLLVIRATQETWMRVKADKNPSFQIILKTGEKFERKAANFDIDIGNAGGIKVQFKGKNIENLGKPGEVVHLRLPKLEN
jgi:cytoskeletal protein RodZ